MPTTPIRFVYHTGITRPVFRNLRLVGSWDDEGRHSAAWTSVPMAPAHAFDGCPAFEAVVRLDEGGVGRDFGWGVMLDGPSGTDVWGIVTEAGGPQSTDRGRTFTLAPAGKVAPREEHYFLSHSRHLGAQKCHRPGIEHPGVRFGVWAPNARAVEVVFGEFGPTRDRQTGYIADNPAATGRDPELAPVPLARHDDGSWFTDPDHPALGDFSRFDHRPYMFRVTRDDGSVVHRTDLYSRCQIGKGFVDPGGAPYAGHYTQLDGTKGCSVVVNPDTVARRFEEQVWPEIEFDDADVFWQNEMNPASPLPTRVEDLVIYELHVGSLGSRTGSPGDFSGVFGFLDHLVALGVNAVELLPVMEFEGIDQWGYGTSHYFACEFSTGGRDQLKHVVRACHQRGIAVILDVVFNHYIHRGERNQWMFDTTAHERNIYFWYEERPDDYPAFEAAAAAYALHPDGRDHPPVPGHGGYVDNMSTGYAPRFHEPQIRKMFTSSVIALAEEFHVDGFRFDQTTSIHSFNVLHADGRPVPAANVFGARFLRECTRAVKMIRPRVILIAEDHSGSDKVTQSPDNGGLGFDAAWYADFYHGLVGDASDRGPADPRLLKVAGFGDDRPLAMTAFAGRLLQTAANKVVYSESHDEAGNSPGSHRNLVVAVNGAPLDAAACPWAEARVRWIFGVTALSAGTPMFLMGEEVGAVNDLRYSDIAAHREDLNALRLGSGAGLFCWYGDVIRLRRREPAIRSRQIDVLHVHDENRVIAFLRAEGADAFLVVASLNNRAFTNSYRITHDALGCAGWKEVLNSDASRYGGWNVGNSGATLPSYAGGIDVVVPANGVVVFRRVH